MVLVVNFFYCFKKEKEKKGLSKLSIHEFVVSLISDEQGLERHSKNALNVFQYKLNIDPKSKKNNHLNYQQSKRSII